MFENKHLFSRIKKSLQDINKVSEKVHNLLLNKVNVLAKFLVKNSVNANLISILGFIIGISAVNFLALNMYGWALACILINRVFDLLDGAVARHSKITEFGIFLDAALDYVFYAGIIFGFALANPLQNAVAASFFLFAFTSSACAMLAYAVIAYKKQTEKQIVFDKSPFYFGGFAQGAEVFLASVVLCILPFWFMEFAIVLGILCLVKAFSIMIAAYYNFVISGK